MLCATYVDDQGGEEYKREEREGRRKKLEKLRIIYSSMLSYFKVLHTYYVDDQGEKGWGKRGKEEGIVF